MAKLLMISGDRALVEGKHGAFYNTLEEFHKYWERVDIICPKVKGKNEKVKSIFGNVYIHPSPWPLIFQLLWIMWVGRRIYRKNKFDLMTVHEYPPFYNGIGAMILHKILRIPYILEIHHIPGYPKSADKKEEIYKILTKIFIKYDSKYARVVRVVNQKESVYFLRESGIPGSKLVYIPSMYIDLEIFNPPYPPASANKKYDLVFASRLEKNKGILNLVEAIKIAKKDKLDIKLLIIGSGSEKANVEAEIKNSKLQDNIFFSGWLETPEDVARAYSSARIFINPSFNEGGPRVVLEAMACGLPVITTRVGLMHDVIHDEETGMFIDWEAHQIAEKILYLLY